MNGRAARAPGIAGAIASARDEPRHAAEAGAAWNVAVIGVSLSFGSRPLGSVVLAGR